MRRRTESTDQAPCRIRWRLATPTWWPSRTSWRASPSAQVAFLFD